MSKIKTTESGRPLYIESSISQKRAYMAWWRETNRTRYNAGRLSWAKTNRDKRSFQARRNHLKQQYGLTPEEFTKLLKKQKGKCPICGDNLKKTVKDKKGRIKMLCYVDHDHKTGKIRGVLCFHCNTGLGHLKDNIRVVKSAVKYLKDTK